MKATNFSGERGSNRSDALNYDVTNELEHFQFSRHQKPERHRGVEVCCSVEHFIVYLYIFFRSELVRYTHN